MTAALEVVRLGDGDVSAEVVPGVGARLHRLRAFGIDVLRTPPDPAVHLADPWFWGSYPLAPWCNRIPTGRREVGGRTVDLPSNFPDGTAIHGQVATTAWTNEGDGAFSVRGGSDGWPWPYEVRQRLEASAAELRLTLALTNHGDTAMPAGLGIHPWFRDRHRVAIRAGRVHPSNLDPSRDPEPVAGDLDRREPGELAEGVDAAWTDLDDPPVILVWPGERMRATLRPSPNARYVVAARLAGIDATAVEPETHAPAGLRRLLGGEPGGLEMLAPSATLTLTVGFAFERLDP